MLGDLEQLAHEASSEKRRELLGQVTSLFLDGSEHHTDREVTLYADVVLQVLGEVDLEARAEYSERIATEPSIPVPVVRHLAHDKVDIAAPVLTLSPILTEVDLVKVAERRSQGHLMAISKRATLSETVTDTLIRRGDTEVVRSVSGNSGAQFSASGLQNLASRSEHDETVRRNLLERDDLREALFDRVLPLISSDYAVRLRLLIYQADEQVLGEVAQTTVEGVEEEQVQASRYRLELRAIIKQITEGSLTVDRAVIYLAAQGRFTDVISLLGKVSSLPENVVSNVMFKTSTEPVAIICRAIGMTDAGCGALLEIRARRLRLPRSEVERGLRDFAKITEDTAKRSLRFVKVRASVA